MNKRKHFEQSDEMTAVLEKAVEKCGFEKQSDHAIEEMAELIVALNHYKRCRINKEPVIEEIADVIIAVSQMKSIFGSSKVDFVIEYKLNRLKERLS